MERVSGNGVTTRGSEEGRSSDAASCRTASPTHNGLSYSCPKSLVWLHQRQQRAVTNLPLLLWTLYHLSFMAITEGGDVAMFYLHPRSTAWLFELTVYDQFRTKQLSENVIHDERSSRPNTPFNKTQSLSLTSTHSQMTIKQQRQNTVNNTKKKKNLWIVDNKIKLLTLHRQL